MGREPPQSPESTQPAVTRAPVTLPCLPFSPCAPTLDRSETGSEQAWGRGSARRRNRGEGSRFPSHRGSQAEAILSWEAGDLLISQV